MPVIWNVKESIRVGKELSHEHTCLWNSKDHQKEKDVKWHSYTLWLYTNDWSTPDLPHNKLRPSKNCSVLSRRDHGKLGQALILIDQPEVLQLTATLLASQSCVLSNILLDFLPWKTEQLQNAETRPIHVLKHIALSHPLLQWEMAKEELFDLRNENTKKIWIIWDYES